MYEGKSAVVIILGPDNKPIDLSAYKTSSGTGIIKNFKAVTNIDYIKKPPGSKLIVFLQYTDEQPLKFRNAPLESGYYKMFLKIYEGMNFEIIPLTGYYFSLDINEKVNYLNSTFKKFTEESNEKVISV